MGRDGWHDGLLMELLAGEERSQPPRCAARHSHHRVRRVVGPAHGAHVEAAERWMAPGRWGWTGGGRGRLIGTPVLKPVETAVKRR